MAGLAVMFGGVSYFAGNQWLDNQAQARLNEIENRNKSNPGVELGTVVVASEQLRFGQEISAEQLKEIPWPVDSVPQGAFNTIEEMIGDTERKAVKTIEAGEPILAMKITGGNNHAGLAGVISDGMRAVTIPVDLVNGVGGFVLPGDNVDIVLTKKNRDNGEQTADIIMENVKVLSIDQDAERAVKGAKVAKSVTLETDTLGAQRLALANSVGRLSLLLRGAGDEAQINSNILSADELINGKRPDAASAASDNGLFSFLTQDKKKTTANISVIRLDEVVNHSVPVLEETETRNEQQEK
ncbi:MAG: Flp pilus assembly protein CpaB [Rhizobiaceae bacterium]